MVFALGASAVGVGLSVLLGLQSKLNILSIGPHGLQALALLFWTVLLCTAVTVSSMPRFAKRQSLFRIGIFGIAFLLVHLGVVAVGDEASRHSTGGHEDEWAEIFFSSLELAAYLILWLAVVVIAVSETVRIFETAHMTRSGRSS